MIISDTSHTIGVFTIALLTAEFFASLGRACVSLRHATAVAKIGR